MKQLDQLAAQHGREEKAEAARDILEHLRPCGVVRPPGGELPASSAWLERLYAGNRMAKEKKPCVFDHLRSHGPWMVSVDEPPLSVMDGMSQTATVCAGFAEDEVVRAYAEGAFGGSPLYATDTSLGDCPHQAAFAALLGEQLPGLPHVTFTNGGAEAVEKAFALV
jgi:adenosylmethionine-8-amino-7-oxononanoate aminotransferase